MKTKLILEKLNELDFDLSDFTLGDFDAIGEFTAKKNRDPNSLLYKKAGCYFRPNYERGILINALIRKYEISSFLEIGFGRGYSTFCAAHAMSQKGIDGKIVTVDPNFNENHIQNLSNIFPKEWFETISFVNGTSQEAIPGIEGKFDLVLIDGDHTSDAVKKDWELVKEKFNMFVIFDDYHLPSKDSGPGIQVAPIVDAIEGYEKDLVIMDRRIFFDDRGYSDEEIDYGQVILTNPNFDTSKFEAGW